MAKRLHADPSRALAKFRRDVAGQPAPTSSEWEVGHIQAKHDQRWKNLKDFTTLAKKAELSTQKFNESGEVIEGGVTSKAWEGIKGTAGKFKDSLTDDKGVFQGGKQGRVLGKYRDEQEGSKKNKPPSSDPESMDMSAEMQEGVEAGTERDEPKQPNVNEKLQKVKAMGGTALKALAYGAAMTNPVTGTLATAYGLNQLQQKKHDEEYYGAGGQSKEGADKEQLTEKEALKEYQTSKNEERGWDETEAKNQERYKTDSSYGPNVERQDPDTQPGTWDREKAGVFKKSEDYKEDMYHASKDPKFVALMEEKLGPKGFKRYKRRQARNRGEETTFGGKIAEKAKGYAEKIGEVKKNIEASGLKHSKGLQKAMLQKQHDKAIEKMTPEITKMGQSVIHELNSKYMAQNPDVAVDWEGLMNKNKELASELTGYMYGLGISDPAEQNEFVRLSYAITLGQQGEEGGMGKPDWKLLGGDEARRYGQTGKAEGDIQSLNPKQDIGGKKPRKWDDMKTSIKDTEDQMDYITNRLRGKHPAHK